MEADSKGLRHVVLSHEELGDVLITVNDLVRSRMKHLENPNNSDLELYRQL